MTLGRPPHEPTAITRRKVTTCAGSGVSQEDIATLLGIDAKTLVKHYRHELTVGAQEARHEILEVVRKQAKKGSLPAARLYLCGTRRPEPLAQPPLGSEQPEAVSPTADGVKAARDRAATTAQKGSEWAEVLPRPKALQ